MGWIRWQREVRSLFTMAYDPRREVTARAVSQIAARDVRASRREPSLPTALEPFSRGWPLLFSREVRANAAIENRAAASCERSRGDSQIVIGC